MDLNIEISTRYMRVADLIRIAREKIDAATVIDPGPERMWLIHLRKFRHDPGILRLRYEVEIVTRKLGRA